MWYRKSDNNSKEYVSTCVILRKNNDNVEVLLVKRANNPHKNKWCIPGGHLKDNEKPIDAAIREIKEETNIDLEKNNLIFIGQINDKTINNHIYAILDKTFNKEKADSDAKETKWYDIKKLPDLIWDNEDHIKEAFKILNKNL